MGRVIRWRRGGRFVHWLRNRTDVLAIALGCLHDVATHLDELPSPFLKAAPAALAHRDGHLVVPVRSAPARRLNAVSERNGARERSRTTEGEFVSGSSESGADRAKSCQARIKEKSL